MTLDAGEDLDLLGVAIPAEKEVELIAALDDEDEAIIGRDEGLLIELEPFGEQRSMVFGRDGPRPAGRERGQSHEQDDLTAHRSLPADEMHGTKPMLRVWIPLRQRG